MICWNQKTGGRSSTVHWDLPSLAAHSLKFHCALRLTVSCGTQFSLHWTAEEWDVSPNCLSLIPDTCQCIVRVMDHLVPGDLPAPCRCLGTRATQLAYRTWAKYMIVEDL
jgi:hypothetical protein